MNEYQRTYSIKQRWTWIDTKMAELVGSYIQQQTRTPRRTHKEQHNTHLGTNRKSYYKRSDPSYI